MNRRFAFRIPASTSNLGAGFDTLSLALDLYLRIGIETSSANELAIAGVDAEKIPRGPDNLILRVIRRIADLRKRALPTFRLTVKNEIPLQRGLGSSAAAIVAGVTCYETVTDDRLSEQEIFQTAFEFEPHPDNLTAALNGGLVTAAMTPDGQILMAKLPVPNGIRPIVVIPEFELSTEKARSVLPRSYSRDDTVYNIQRTALTVAGLTTGNFAVLRESMRDRIHHPYRVPLIPGLDEILELSIPGLIGIALSGAGPSIFAFATSDDAERIGEAITKIFDKHGVKATPHIVNVDNTGRFIEAS